MARKGALQRGRAGVFARYASDRTRNPDFYDNLDEYVSLHSDLGDPDEWDAEQRRTQNAFAYARRHEFMTDEILGDWLIMLGRRSPHDTHRPGETP